MTLIYCCFLVFLALAIWRRRYDPKSIDMEPHQETDNCGRKLSRCHPRPACHGVPDAKPALSLNAVNGSSLKAQRLPASCVTVEVLTQELTVLRNDSATSEPPLLPTVTLTPPELQLEPERPISPVESETSVMDLVNVGTTLRMEVGADGVLLLRWPEYCRSPEFLQSYAQVTLHLKRTESSFAILHDMRCCYPRTIPLELVLRDAAAIARQGKVTRVALVVTVNRVLQGSLNAAVRSTCTRMCPTRVFRDVASARAWALGR